MTKFKLTSNLAHNDTEDHVRRSIGVYDGSILVCLIFDDGQLAPQSEDFLIEELENFIFIAKNFDLHFENIEMKERLADINEIIRDQDAIIRQLELENESVYW